MERGHDREDFKGKELNLYGLVTVGKRGQVVIPAKARRVLGITPATKLLVFSKGGCDALILAKAELASQFVNTLNELIDNQPISFANLFKTAPARRLSEEA